MTLPSAQRTRWCPLPMSRRRHWTASASVIPRRRRATAVAPRRRAASNLHRCRRTSWCCRSRAVRSRCSPSRTRSLSSPARAAVLPSPAAMVAVTPAGIVTATGVRELLVVPLPSSPTVLFPQADTFPSEPTARLWLAPAAAAVAVTPAGSDTLCGSPGVRRLAVPQLPVTLFPHEYSSGRPHWRATHLTRLTNVDAAKIDSAARDPEEPCAAGRPSRTSPSWPCEQYSHGRQ